jgi:hypothetical protein
MPHENNFSSLPAVDSSSHGCNKSEHGGHAGNARVPEIRSLGPLFALDGAVLGLGVGVLVEVDDADEDTDEVDDDEEGPARFGLEDLNFSLGRVGFTVWWVVVSCEGREVEIDDDANADDNDDDAGDGGGGGDDGVEVDDEEVVVGVVVGALVMVEEGGGEMVGVPVRVDFEGPRLVFVPFDAVRASGAAYDGVEAVVTAAAAGVEEETGDEVDDGEDNDSQTGVSLGTALRVALEGMFALGARTPTAAAACAAYDVLTTVPRDTPPAGRGGEGDCAASLGERRVTGLQGRESDCGE